MVARMKWALVARSKQDISSNDLDGQLWRLTVWRDHDERHVDVLLTRSALLTGGPDDVSRAVRTKGRTAVTDVLEWDEPPTRIRVSTEGISSTGGKR